MDRGSMRSGSVWAQPLWCAIGPRCQFGAAMLNQDQLDQAQSILKHSFADQDLLQRAFIHASVTDSRLESNERLEFLGDSILGMFVCERIFSRYPNYLEGEMTKIKSVAVSRNICAAIARKIGLEDLLILGKGIRGREGGLPHSLAAAVLESTIAAVYMDGGFESVAKWLGPLLDEHIDRAYTSGHQQNFKSVLQQHVQRRYQETPEYMLLEQEGPDHAKTFRVSVKISGTTYEPGEGASKKQAEQKAALIALQTLEIVERHEDGSVRLI